MDYDASLRALSLMASFASFVVISMCSVISSSLDVLILMYFNRRILCTSKVNSRSFVTVFEQHAKLPLN